MAPDNNFVAFSAAATALFLIIAAAANAPPVDARPGAAVNPFCGTATYKDLCTDMVKGAANLHDASMNAMKSSLVLAKKIKSLAPEPEKLPPQMSPKDPVAQKNQVEEICKDNVDGVVDDLEESLEALEKKDVGTVRTHLSGALRTDCQDAMSESKVDFPFSGYLGDMKKMIDNCLAVVMQN